MKRLIVPSLLLVISGVCFSEITGLITEPGGSDTQVQYNNSGAFQGDADLTFNGSTLTVTGLSVTTGTITNLVPGGLTSGRVPYFNGTKLVDDADFSFNGTTVAVTGVSATSMTVSGASSFGTISGGGLSATTGDFSGAMTAPTLDTGQGANELYDMNQNVQTTDNPTFSGATLTYGVGATTGVFSGNVDAGSFSGDTLDTGNGANELFPMDQSVMTTSSPTFSQITSGGLFANSSSGTANVPFTFNSTTTINSLRVQGRPFLDPTAPPYNAVGDGVTDDDAAIEAALAALPANGVLILPSGYTFGTASGIQVQKDSTTILGLGGKILGLAKGIKIIDTYNHDFVVIRGVRVENTFNDDDADGCSGFGGIHISTNSDHCQVDGNIVINANGSGIVEDGEGYSSVTNNLVISPNEHGIYVSSSYECVVTGNIVIDAGQDTELAGSPPSLYGIKIDGAEHCVISNNVVRNPLTLGIQFADDSKFNTVSNNTIYMPDVTTAGNGIVGSGGSSSFNIIKGNTIYQASPYPGIETTSNSAHYLIEGNIVYLSSTSTSGMLIGGPAQTVKNNKIIASTTTTYGINVTGNAAKISGNEIMGTGSGVFTTGIRLAGTGDVVTWNLVSASTKYSDAGTGTFISDIDSGPGLDIGNSGRKMTLFLGETTTWNPASLTNGSATYGNVTVTGAVVGDFAYATLDTLTTGSMFLGAVVTGTNQVSVSLINHSGGTVDVANGNLKVRVIRW